ATTTGCARRKRPAASARSTIAMGRSRSRKAAASSRRCASARAINRSLRRASSMKSSIRTRSGQQLVAILLEFRQGGGKQLRVGLCGVACAHREERADCKIRGRKEPRGEDAVGIPGQNDDEERQKNGAEREKETGGQRQQQQPQEAVALFFQLRCDELE